MGRVALLVAAAAVLVGVLGGCGHEQSGTGTAPGANPDSGSAARAPASTTPSVRTINVKVGGGKVSGDTGRIMVPLGTLLVVSVNSDVADEIHVHGYDRKAKVPAAGTSAVAFSANTPGVFDVELEGAKLRLLQLQVG
jgi:hypothetical protein